VVPSCLNTFLFQVEKCKDNTDAACYCPNALFVKTVFNCIYAHGESDEIIQEAILYFQGICAPHVPENPEIVKPTVTSYITPTVTATVPVPVYTTITVSTTTVVPCTDDAGEIIESSSTTLIIDTTVEVPQVDFSTVPGNTDDVEIVPITSAKPVETPSGDVPVPTTTAGVPAESTPVAPPITSAAPVGPTGTGGVVVPTGPSSAFPPIVTAGSGRVTAGFGFAVAAAIIAAF